MVVMWLLACRPDEVERESKVKGGFGENDGVRSKSDRGVEGCQEVCRWRMCKDGEEGGIDGLNAVSMYLRRVKVLSYHQDLHTTQPKALLT